MSDRLELLKPLINATRRRLAEKRLLEGERLIERNGRRLFDDADVKIALLLVHEMNPWEEFSKEEQAFLRGVSSDTLNRRTDLKPL